MINKVILIGNVGADPEVRSLEGGIKVARVNLATTERIYNRATQETKEHTEWHNVTLWRNLAETADRFIKKGSKIYIEGRIRSRTWTDDTGAKRYAIDIVADDLKLLDRRPDSGAVADSYSAPAATPTSYAAPTSASTSSPAQSQAATPQPPMNDPDDLPF